MDSKRKTNKRILSKLNDEMNESHLISNEAPNFHFAQYMNKKKIIEIQDCLFGSQTSISIIHGPSGCGKTHTVNYLAKINNYVVVSWDDSIRINEFLDFLTISVKYVSLNNHQTNFKKLIVVEDFPSLVSNNLWKFHGLLRQISNDICFPIVFLFSDDYKFQTVLPKSLCKELNISIIKINPIAKGNFLKVMSNEFNDKESLDLLYQHHTGDLRSLKNTMKFYGKNFSVDDFCFKDTIPSIFHSFGKIFYAKRQSSLNDSDLLPFEMQDFCRNKLIASFKEIEVIVTEYIGIFSLGLFENYLTHINSIMDIYKVTQYLSISDYISSYWNEVDNSLFNEYATLINCLSIIFFVGRNSNNKNMTHRKFLPFSLNQLHSNRSLIIQREWDILNSVEFNKLNTSIDVYVQDYFFYKNLIEPFICLENKDCNNSSLIDESIIEDSDNSNSDLFYGDIDC